MAGHSHWHNIQRKKNAEDAKRSKMFGKLSREISIAAREGGGDPESNPSLRQAVERAKEHDMPKDNIEKAIKRGTGELEGAGQLERVTYEAYGPEGVAILIDGITDNRNRSLSEIRQLVEQYGGKLTDKGAVQWMFEQAGLIHADTSALSEDTESIELAAIEAGAEDTQWIDETTLALQTQPTEFAQTCSALQERGFAIQWSALGWVPKEQQTVQQEEKVTRLFEALDETDTVQEIYSNAQL